MKPPRPSRWTLALAPCLLFSPLALHGQTAELPVLFLEELASGLASPVAVTHAGDERLYVVKQDGQILIWEDGGLLAEPFLDIDPLVGSSGNEQGLFSIAFHPDYAANGLFFVDYTDTSGNTVVARYRVSADRRRADPQSARILLEIDQPFSNHNGGQLQFGPDGMLYVATGDGGSANDPQCRAQDRSTLLGKILRLDADRNSDQPPYHAIPADNPFVGDDGADDEIWALGLRNPWRFSFDRQTGDLYIGDVGQSAREEIDFQPASSLGGENYGWKVMEGTLCLGSTSGCGPGVPGCNDPAYTAPILDYGRAGGNCSVIGGYVYRGSDIPELDGRYLFGDFCSGRLWVARRVGPAWQSELLDLALPQLTAFGEDADGEIHLTSRDGRLFRLRAERAADPGRIELRESAVTVAESGGQAVLSASRVGGSDGQVSVAWSTSPATAEAGSDYRADAGLLAWEDGEQGGRTFSVPVVDDDEVEGEETFSVLLSSPTGGAMLGRSSAVVTIEDDDLETGPCQADTSTLCLNDARFRVEIGWRTPSGQSGEGRAETLTSDTGYFWFFLDTNVEVVVKVLDACGQPSPRYWVFAAGLTNVETELLVTDTETGARRRYTNRQGEPFLPVLDTDAFAGCP